jgi:capsular polysaccharide transport system permease protein
VGYGVSMDGLDVTVVGSGSRTLGYSGRERPSRAKPPKRRLSLFHPFLLLVVLPSLLTGIYLYGYASDQYVSEARFVVRGPTQQSAAGLSSLLASAGMSRTEDDTYAVQDYILSRDALTELVKQQDLKTVYGRPDADRLSRFPMALGIDWYREDTFEHLFKYYLKHVDVHMDTTTGVSDLTVKSFRAEDSQRIAAALLAAGERLVNRMNEREHENALRDARNEVKLAEKRLQDVSARVADFRNREATLDPNKQSVPMLAAITTQQARLSSMRLEISQLQSSSPNSPLLGSMRQRAQALQAQIDDAKSKITGTDSSLVPKIREFDMLTLDREFADKQLSSAISSLEIARINADRQQKYLEAIVMPNVADYADYPRRASTLAVVFATLLGIYVMGALLVAGAREHRLV